MTDAEETMFMWWYDCQCASCADPDDWYQALAFLLAERSPA